MKRSDCAHKLADLIEKQRQDLNNGSDYQDAEAILDFLEDLGMLPASFYFNDSGFMSSKEAVKEHDMYGEFKWEEE